MKIKYPAVIVATLVHYILGGLWYSPALRKQVYSDHQLVP